MRRPTLFIVAITACLFCPPIDSLSAPLKTIRRPQKSPTKRTSTTILDIFKPDYEAPKKYGRYVVLNQLQNLTTSLRNSLSTLFILSAFGKSSPSIALTATLSFLARDGAGMLATLAFSKFAPPFSLSTDLKRWRYAADVTCDVALLSEFLTSYMIALPESLFIASLCLANMMKAVCGMMASAASGPIDLFWASGDPSNLPGLSSKSAAQNTISNSVGIIAGALLSTKASALKRQVLISGYLGLTLFHLLANRALLRTVALTSLPEVRARLAIDQWMREGKVGAPGEIAAAEPLCFGGSRGKRVLVGADLPEGIETTVAGRVFKYEKDGNVYVCLPEGGSCLEGLFHGLGGENYDGFRVACVEAGWDASGSSIQDLGYRVGKEIGVDG